MRIHILGKDPQLPVGVNHVTPEYLVFRWVTCIHLSRVSVL